jgi:hypothetical protein
VSALGYRPRPPSLVHMLAAIGGLVLAALYASAGEAASAAVYAGVSGFLLGGEVRDLITWLVWRRP